MSSDMKIWVSVGSEPATTKQWKIESWQSLVHVCRRRRGIVFRSPRRLNQLCQGLIFTSFSPFGEAFGLKRPSKWTYVVRASFSRFILGWICPTFAIPCLHFRSISRITEITLSANHLVHLTLLSIPRSGYISPETIAICLSVLTSLVTFNFTRQPFPDQESRRPPPPTRSVLPALEMFLFNGVSKYLEKLLAQIVAPDSTGSRQIFSMILTLTPQGSVNSSVNVDIRDI